MLSFALALSVLPLIQATAIPRAPSAAAFVAPSSGGGSELDIAGTGVGEPLNVRPPRYMSRAALPT
jgi:hypothetical protein